MASHHDAASLRGAGNDDVWRLAQVLELASAIGERMARLAGGGQLLAVTHSPQVAARGSQHYMIAKSSEGTVTRTSVVLLDSGGRKEEIARMLSGAEVTLEARAQADRLLEGA